MKKEDSSVGVWLNIFSRPHNIESLIESYLQQSLPPSALHCQIETPVKSHSAWICYADLLERLSEAARAVGCCLTWSLSNLNSGVWGRFSSCKAMDCRYILIADDDTYPGCHWLRSCLETSLLYDCACTTYGIRFKGDTYDYFDNHVYGWRNPSSIPECVDFMGHNWFFKKEWIDSLPTHGLNNTYLRSGEDLYISHFIKDVAGKAIVVPPHPLDDREFWGSTKGLEEGCGKEAISMDSNALDIFRMQFVNVRFMGFNCIDDLKLDDPMVQISTLRPPLFHMTMGKIFINQHEVDDQLKRACLERAIACTEKLVTMRVCKDVIKQSLPFTYLRGAYID